MVKTKQLVSLWKTNLYQNTDELKADLPKHKIKVDDEFSLEEKLIRAMQQVYNFLNSAYSKYPDSMSQPQKDLREYLKNQLGKNKLCVVTKIHPNSCQQCRQPKTLTGKFRKSVEDLFSPTIPGKVLEAPPSYNPYHSDTESIADSEMGLPDPNMGTRSMDDTIPRMYPDLSPLRRVQSLGDLRTIETQPQPDTSQSNMYPIRDSIQQVKENNEADELINATHDKIYQLETEITALNIVLQDFNNRDATREPDDQVEVTQATLDQKYFELESYREAINQLMEAADLARNSSNPSNRSNHSNASQKANQNANPSSNASYHSGNHNDEENENEEPEDQAPNNTPAQNQATNNNQPREARSPAQPQNVPQPRDMRQPPTATTTRASNLPPPPLNATISSYIPSYARTTYNPRWTNPLGATTRESHNDQIARLTRILEETANTIIDYIIEVDNSMAAMRALNDQLSGQTDISAQLEIQREQDAVISDAYRRSNRFWDTMEDSRQKQLQVIDEDPKSTEALLHYREQSQLFKDIMGYLTDLRARQVLATIKVARAKPDRPEQSSEEEESSKSSDDNGDNAQLRESCNRLRPDVQILTKNNDTLIKKLRNYKFANRNIKQTNGQITQDLNNLRQQWNKLAAQHDNTKTALANAQEEILELTGEAIQLKTKLAKRERDLVNSQLEVTDLKNKA